jgi:hypothetical protein
MKRKDTRPLTVNGTPWEYKIGKNTVAIYDPEGKRYFPKFTEIVGEEAVKDKQFYLNPATILNHILTKILVDNPKHNRCICCNTVKADVYLQPNPFDAEIHQDYTPHFFCNNCVNDLTQEI